MHRWIENLLQTLSDTVSFAIVVFYCSQLQMMNVSTAAWLLQEFQSWICPVEVVMSLYFHDGVFPALKYQLLSGCLGLLQLRLPRWFHVL